MVSKQFDYSLESRLILLFPIDVAHISGVLVTPNFVFSLGYVNPPGAPCGSSAIYQGVQ